VAPNSEPRLHCARARTGAQGEQGLKGEIGAQGDQGLTGEQGLQGEQGIQGPVGPSGIGPLIHDSGWIYLAPSSRTLIVNLEDRNVLVYMIGYNGWNEHQRYFGQDVFIQASGVLVEQGAFWTIAPAGETEGVLEVWRLDEDQDWDFVRVLVWQIPQVTPP